MAPLTLRSAPFLGSALFARPTGATPDLAFADVRLTPHDPSQSPLGDVLRFVTAGSDQYITEKYAVEIEAVFRQWGQALCESPQNHSKLANALEESIDAVPLVPVRESRVRSGFGIEVMRREFAEKHSSLNRDGFVECVRTWLRDIARIETAEFEMYRIEQMSQSPLAVRAAIRYDLVAQRKDQKREERVGSWRTEWVHDDSRGWRARMWETEGETLSVVAGPGFIDVTTAALGGTESYLRQMLSGADYWRTVLDGAIGVNVYCNNGVAAGDFDNDGFDDFYVCQTAGLPNRLYRNRGDGTFEDMTEKAGVGVLDNTACALFADFRNIGRQDLLVVCGTGPLLFLNRGDGTFEPKHGAFRFQRPPQGTFTHAAVGDYDLDGRLDIYFCTYQYYLGLDQYHYPIPYYNARNGPPNCLVHNEGDGNFVETTEAAGLNVDNDRYSFAAAWGDSNGNRLPDLFVANDFGSSQLYRNNGDGTFTVVSSQAHVEGVGAGMSCCWADFDNDGLQDIYVPSMWEAAGQRVSGQKQFHEGAPEPIRQLYQRHARGNALYRNKGDTTFENVGQQAGVEMGRWSWSSDFWDLDNDGYADLYVSNGYLSEVDKEDLASFFWRQVVAKSSEDATPALAYERGWNAINELIRSDHTWHGYARNVMFANNRDGTFSEISGAVGMDFRQDCRSFALADIDHDGRLEVILKSRNAPQVRILHNAMIEIGDAISFRLKGTRSNRDAIGASITVEAGTLRQTKYLQAGSGFLAQHSKELFFGVGKAVDTPIRATVHWPDGGSGIFENLPVNKRITIEEGSHAFHADAFASVAPSYQQPPPTPKLESLPQTVETWLVDPLKAPLFSLPDLSARSVRLSSFQGRPVLLNFWATVSPQSLEQLRSLEAAATGTLGVLAVNVDRGEAVQAARSFAWRQHLSFPVLLATDDIAGIYNIIYRHLFDRRRDLPLPISFLLDREGMIVKVYQGLVDWARVRSDLDSIPGTNAQRMQRALPFPGLLLQDEFERNEFTYGVAMVQHGYLDQAAESFRQVIASKPEDADAYYNLGTLNLKKKDFVEARKSLDQALKLRPNYPEAWNNLGMMAAQQGSLDEAIADFQQSLKLRPSYAVALLNLGNVFRRQRSFDQAQDCLTRALALEPDDPEVHYSLGMLYAQQDQPQKAFDYLERALALRPDYPEALNNLGVLLVREQQYAKAEDHFKTAVRVAPQFEQSYLNLARLYAIENQREQARAVLMDLLRLQPDNAAARQALESLQ